MALFDTPSLLGKIYEKQTFPQGGGGFAGLLGGITGGVAAGKNYKNADPESRSFVGALQEAAARGAENSAEISQPIHPVQRRVASQNLMMNSLKIEDAILSRDNAIRAKAGMTEMNRVMAESLGANADLDMTLKKLYDVGSRYAIPPEQFDGMVERVQIMKQRRDQVRLFESLLQGRTGMDQTIRVTDPITGAQVTLSDPNKVTAERLEELAVQAEQNGDPEAAMRYRNAIPNYQSKGFITKLTDINANLAQLRAQADRATKYERAEIEAEIAGLEAKKQYYESVEPQTPSAGSNTPILDAFMEWKAKQQQ
jgi:hypothetical protein